MAWPRIKNPRSSALPGTHEHDGVQVTVTPAPDADPAPNRGQNTGISGTQHAVADPQSAPIRYADSGVDDVSAEYDDTAGVVYEAPPVNGGIEILNGVVTTEVPDDEPPTVDMEMPGPRWNESLAEPPTPVDMALQSEPPPDADAGTRAAVPGTSSGKDSGVPAGSPAAGGEPAARFGVRDLPPDVRIRMWRWRAIIMIAVGVVFTIVANWPVGLTLAILAGIADTIYRSRTAMDIPTGGSQSRAQRHTARQLAKMRRAGYLTLGARPIPNSREVIDHLVIGPTGVYAIDSEKWHKNMPIRTRNGKQLWHGPDSKKQRLEHASWEARQASELLSAAAGKEVTVRPAMAIYGPKVPWDIATIRDVDVFSGPALGKYLKQRRRVKGAPQLSRDEVQDLYVKAAKVLPDVAPTRTAAPVG